MFALLVPATSADAECIALWKDGPDALERSTLVFSGTVISGHGVEVVFDVDRVWKGNVERKTTLWLMPGMEMITFDKGTEGRTYLVFASFLKMFSSPDLRRADGSSPGEVALFEISSCSPTRPLANAQELVRQIGSGKPPRN